MTEYGPVIPAFRYRHARAAIDFLVKAFGFAEHMVVPGAGDLIEHAQLSHGSGMIMLGSYVEGDAFSGLGTSSVYVVVDDADAHHDTAVANGAEIVFPLESPEYGGRAYTARDPEGNIWSFGTYDPE